LTGGGTSPGFVDEMDLLFPIITAVNARDIILQFGTPCTVFTGTNGYRQLVLRYPGAVVIFGRNGQSNVQVLRQGSTVIEIHIFDNFKSCEEVLVKYQSEGDQPWHGFGKY
jgi:hypothetical protein